MLRNLYPIVRTNTGLEKVFKYTHKYSVLELAEEKLNGMLKKYGVRTKEQALLLAASQGAVDDVLSLVSEFDAPLNTLCQESGLMPIELAYKHNKFKCVATLLRFHRCKKVYSELVDLLLKYATEEGNYPYKELALARAMEAQDVNSIKIFIEKYDTNEEHAESLLNRRVIYLEIFWQGYQAREDKTGNISVSSFLINIGDEQFKVNLSSKLKRGIYDACIPLSVRGASAVYPGDFGRLELPMIVTGLPLDPQNLVTARYEALQISEFEILSTYHNRRVSLNSAPTTIKNNMKYRLDLVTHQSGLCTADLKEVGFNKNINSTFLLRFKLRQMFKNFFVMQLNDKDPCFFPSNHSLKNSPLNDKIDFYFDSFVESLDATGRDMLAWKAELKDIGPFMSDLIGTYGQEFKLMLTKIYFLQLVKVNDHREAEKLANAYMEKLRERYVISSKPEIEANSRLKINPPLTAKTDDHQFVARRAAYNL